MGISSEMEEARSLLARAWEELPGELRGPAQFLGRHYAGCSATIGVMPRCDFACRGCYLGGEANLAQPLALAEIKEQLRLIRRRLGPAGNVQITDGEVTLRDPSELAELIAYARGIGLVPMLMTHGETFRRTPGLLERLMVQGGLTEVGLHIDATMRGRGGVWDGVESEEGLEGLRDEFARMIRTARRRTGLRLEAASTVTVTRCTLDGVPAVVRWFLRNADAFKMVSFQPLAAVGRSDSSLEGVSVEELWQRIAEGAGDPELSRGEGRFGHPACTRLVQGIVTARRGRLRLVPLYLRDCDEDMAFLDGLLERLGGMSFRLDGQGLALRRALWIVVRHGPFLAGRAIPHLLRLVRRSGGLRGRYFSIVSHHFMNAAETATHLGKERLSACAFRVPINGAFEPMCAVNALGLREAFYRFADSGGGT